MRAYAHARKNWRDAFNVVMRRGENFRDRNVEGGNLTYAVSPDKTMIIEAPRQYGLTSGDFEGHLIQAIMDNVADVPARALHDRLLKYDDGYAERYREEKLKMKRRGK